MKLSRKEFEAQLAIARTLADDAKKSMIDALKSAEVYDLVDGKEVAVVVEIKELATPAAPQPDITKAVAEAVAKELAALKVAQPKLWQPEQKCTIPVTVKRVTLKSFRGERDGKSAEERAYRFGLWAMAAMGHDGAAKSCTERGIELKTAHSEGTNSTGGYLVPDEVSYDIIALIETYGAARKLLKVSPMTSDTKTVQRRVSGLTAYFVGENAAGTESNKGWDQVTLVAKKIMAIARMSNELSADAAISIGDDLAQEIAYAFAYKEDVCAFNGDGTSTYGGIVGLNPALKNLNGVDDGGGLILATGNTFAEHVIGDFNAMIGRLPQYADTPSTKWVCHKTFYETAMQRLANAAGGVTATELINGTRQRTFLGYPVEFAAVMPKADVNSQVNCLFGDFSLAATLGDRQQLSISFSTEAVIGGESVFERDQIAVRGTERFDVVVHDIGTATEAGPVVGLISAGS